MAWFDLGTHTVGLEWQSTGFLLVASQVIRITQTYNVSSIQNGRLVLRMEYPNGETGDYRVIYPSTTPELIEFPLPSAFLKAGLVSRRLGFKQTRRSSTIADVNWQVQLEAFTEDAGDGVAAQVIDGGEDV